jgi:CheY-like chemotaxis protein
MEKNIKCCLLVEDDPEDQELFIDALHSISSTTGCYAVANGEEALFALLDENLVPDYIFTDLHMPRMGGFEFIKILKGLEKFRGIPVIIYTSDYSEETIRNAKALGATAIYSKTRMGFLKEMLKKHFEESGRGNTIL